MSETIRSEQFVEALAKFTIDDLRYLSTLYATPFGVSLKKLLLALQNQSTDAVFSKSTDFSETQYHRGMLQMLREIHLMLGTEAKERYDELERRASAARSSAP